MKIDLPNGAGPAHERLAEAIARSIAEEGLGPEARLPGHREIAKAAGVGIRTVTKAIDLLAERGVLRGEVGRGTFVAGHGATTARDAVIDLTINGPPPVLDRGALQSASEEAVARALRLDHSGYSDLRGTPEQRQAFADWLARAGVGLSAEEFVLTVGAQHALHLAFDDLREVTKTIATEGATFSGAIAAARQTGMRLLPVASDQDGLIPSDLDRVMSERGCRALYTTPICQNPLGFETSGERRRELLDVCQRHDAFIVEDDIYYPYGTKERITYRELAPERTYFLTSLSKCLTPLVRVGVLAPPAERNTRIARALRATLWGTSPLAIETACALLRDRADIRAIERLLPEAKRRVELTAEILGLDDLPMPQGAPHVWLSMPQIEAERLARRASEEGIRLTPPDATAVGGPQADGLRLSVMAPTTLNDLEEALRRIARLRGASELGIV
ncbi:PLP-dependent aminotransferase family protein [Citromicrobium bathyomarinum]